MKKSFVNSLVNLYIRFEKTDIIQLYTNEIQLFMYIYKMFSCRTVSLRFNIRN